MEKTIAVTTPMSHMNMLALLHHSAAQSVSGSALESPRVASTSLLFVTTSLIVLTVLTKVKVVISLSANTRTVNARMDVRKHRLALSAFVLLAKNWLKMDSPARI
jgi:hypothetical protein